MFVKTYGNNNIDAFPYSLEMFREENRNVSLPKFLNNRFLETRNVFPVYEAEKPEFDDAVERLKPKDTPELTEKTVDEVTTNRWELGWNIVEKTQDQINSDFESEKETLLAKINDLRNEHIHQTYTVKISDTLEIPVDIREGKPDLSNISNLVLGASLKKMNGDTSTIIFRDANDNENALTPDEVILMGTTISNMVTYAYEQSWDMKNLVEAASDVYELRAIDTKFKTYVQV